MEEKKLTGCIGRDKIKLLQAPRPPEGVVDAFLALGDCTGVVADVMDELSISCVVVGAHMHNLRSREGHRRAADGRVWRRSRPGAFEGRWVPDLGQ